MEAGQLGGGLAGAFGDDDIGGPEEAIVKLIAFAVDLEDVALGCFVVREVGDGFVKVGVEGMAFTGDFGDTVTGEEVFDLFEDHLHAFEDRRVFGFGAGGFEAEVEIIKDGKERFEDVGVAEFDGIGFLAGHAFPVVIEVSLVAEGEVFPPGDVGFELGDGIDFFRGGLGLGGGGVLGEFFRGGGFVDGVWMFGVVHA
jgi:hypothetical protein